MRFYRPTGKVAREMWIACLWITYEGSNPNN